MLAPDLAQQVFAALPSAAASSNASQRFVPIPDGPRARWLIPTGCRNLNSVLAGWSPYRVDSRLKWHVVRAANRIGCLALLPSVTTSTVAGPDGIDWAALGWNSEILPATLVYLGTPGPSRKAVIHLIDPGTGSCHMVVKVPLTKAARRAILREADVLASLTAEGRTIAPRVLSVDLDRGLSSQTFLPGASGSRKLPPEYLNLLHSLRLPDVTTSIAEHAATIQEQLLWSTASDRDLETITLALEQLCGADALPAFWIHGDFAPWNIRHRSDGSVALLDWEDARPCGLPLQDAFHFLHIQDYLFGRQPRSHAKSLNHFADELRLTTRQCHTLEIAYLIDAYLQRLTQQQLNHSDFVLRTLRAVLPEVKRTEVQGCAGRHQHSPHLVMEPSPVSSQVRSTLFSAVIAEFNSANLTYCILSGYEEYPDRILSDVDFMVHPADMPRVPALLTQAADRCGSRVLQAIQHETSACYFVLAKNGDRQMGFLNPDCCGDYRRLGRLWMRADAILARRQSLKNFYVPSAPDEFIYYLIKKVLKQSIDAHQLQRLHDLHHRSSLECAHRLHTFFPARTADAVERALVTQDLWWFTSNRQHLVSELEGSRPVERPLDRLLSRLRQVNTRLWRILQPTGMCVVVMARDEAKLSSLAAALQQSLEPAFRWTRGWHVANQPCLSFGSTGSQAHRARKLRLLEFLVLPLQVRLARLRSTLAICTINRDQPASARGHWLSSFMRLLFWPDLVLVLDGAVPKTTARWRLRDLLAPRTWRSAVYLKQHLPIEDTVREANATILDWLSTRQERRSSPAKSISSNDVAELAGGVGAD